MYRVDMSLIAWAALSAERLLAPLGDRWRHVQCVADQARRIAGVVPPADHDLLIAAAYLHDIGYAPSLALTGFHPIDGARWIRDCGSSERLARLVAHHSCAIYEASVRGLAEPLAVEFEAEESATYDALVFCDMTTGPTGETVLLEDRVRDIRQRYGPDHAVTVALSFSYPSLVACCERTGARLASVPPHPIYGAARLSR